MHRHLEDTVGTIKFIERTYETSFIRFYNFFHTKHKTERFIRYRSSMNPGKCASNVGRFDGITNTTIGIDCFTGPGKIHNGIAWMVLHEVNNHN